ncbi:LuxR C-terminal-related transcriptional regulator [Bradyrhizobium japonicum]|uniref:Two-component system nitrate/nitrite response regulator NarL n=1 Tax=Bradyrhizobium japonicum TaxID=375 RepID=A0ABV2S1M7_BRAJP|nr:response regulator transcription factor [Bradyrhizobium japonicum]MCP1767432.1 two-component system nitrate/nitrite response regulator NarL [Bradyrhizobium japonicum]MCP1789571.1 two-component system nitrate/nitrite response regulator NarL [Bradyrhizobium japonicum]MCP1802070.1 two-component system nitrate/nitrite response regulator NarL [Bradyrhizobium japonicum]MCP1820380.1 two-component system nitrate/nitrite response regulator NarL [Bradyrhizobium japonicum]MCP1868112.1 two-component sy
MRRATVVIADRHPMVLQGLASVLGSESDFEVVASCGDAASCIQAILTLAPDIAIMDTAMPELTALMNNSLSHSDSRPTRLVFFAPSEDCDLVVAGAPAGYSVLLKEMTGQAVVQGLRDIANGQTVVPLSPTDQAAPREQSPNPESALAVLTERERQIMRLVSRGLSNKEIGRRLHIADGTIKVHLHNIFQKLEIGNRTALAALAISQDDRANSAQDKPAHAGSDPVPGDR